MLRSKTDSINKTKDSRKRREMEEQEREERARMEREMKERKNERERLAESPSSLTTAAREMVPKPGESRDMQGMEPPLDDERGKPIRGRSEQESEQELALAQPESKAARLYFQTMKDNQKAAQDKVMELYDLVENKRGPEALERFKQNRSFIAPNVDPQVFTMLEQTIMLCVIESQPHDSLKSAGNTKEINDDNRPIAPEQEHLDRINGFLRDNKVDAAYAEFKRAEKQLKKFMVKNEFKQLKKMLERAYATRHPKQ